MTPEQELTLVRQAFALDEAFAKAFSSVAKRMADEELRAGYKTLDAAALVRQTGIAEGIERVGMGLDDEPIGAGRQRSPSRKATKPLRCKRSATVCTACQGLGLASMKFRRSRACSRA